MNKVIKDKFFIVNDVDRPCQRFVAELREDGLLHYIFTEFDHDPMSTERATPLEKFGFQILYNESENYYQFSKVADSWAEYKDGAARGWQDSARFFQYHPEPTKFQYMVFIEGKSPPKATHPSLKAAEQEAERILNADPLSKVAHILRKEKTIEKEIKLKTTYELK